tara:strand:+ start:719 stop:1429 length:711 start_codon:yes stop_codon:yes gene_type:complete
MSRATCLFTATFLALSVSCSNAAMAQQQPVVVELYTSQGCSSCPPADAMFAELKGRDDVIAIALHVDYWDYIGWKDEFGNPAHEKRQRAYAAKAGRRSIYTPEMVVNGETDIVGVKPMLLSKAIAEYSAEVPVTAVSAQRSDNKLRIQAAKPDHDAGLIEIHILRLISAQKSKITRGENRGETYEYTNIAHSWQVVGTWDGQIALDMSLAVGGDDPIVVLLQEAGAGKIISAARLD